MLEPKQTVESVETPGAGRSVERVVGGVLGMTFEIGGGSPDPGPYGGTRHRRGRARPGIHRAVPSAAWVGAAGASVRAGPKEAIGVPWSRTRVKRRKASFGWVSWPPAAMPCSCWSRGRIGDVITAKSQRLTPGDLPGSGRKAGRPESKRTEADGPAEVGGSRTTGRRGNAR